MVDTRFAVAVLLDLRSTRSRGTPGLRSTRGHYPRGPRPNQWPYLLTLLAYVACFAWFAQLALLAQLARLLARSAY